MTRPVIFFQGGGGQKDHDTDSHLVASLHAKLNSNYVIHYPLLPNEDDSNFGRGRQIGHEISMAEENMILIAHSFGASMLLKYLSENEPGKKIRGIFLLATPFWGGDEDWVKALALRPHFEDRLDKKVPLFFYHCRDDGEVPFDHLNIYKQKLSWASFHELPFGGHQFNNDLTIVANDILSL